MARYHRGTGPLNPHVGWLWNARIPQSGGADFPASYAGDRGKSELRWSETEEEWAYFDSTRGKWLSVSDLYTRAASWGTTSATNWIWLDYATSSAWKFNGSSVGHHFPFDVTLTGMSINAAGSSTCTVQLFDATSGVSGATISLSSGTSATDNTYDVANISAGSIIGFKVTSGTWTSGGMLTATFKKVFQG